MMMAACVPPCLDLPNKVKSTSLSEWAGYLFQWMSWSQDDDTPIIGRGTDYLFVVSGRPDSDCSFYKSLQFVGLNHGTIDIMKPYNYFARLYSAHQGMCTVYFNARMMQTLPKLGEWILIGIEHLRVHDVGIMSRAHE